MMKTLSDSELAYAAALIDNLARLRTRELGPSEIPVVQVSGVYGALQWLGEATGTKVIETRRQYTRHNCTEHCPESHSHIRSVSNRWSITGVRAAIVLMNTEPFLRVQAAEARRLIDLASTLRYHGSVVNDMVLLGWKIPMLDPHTRARVQLIGASS